MSGIVQQPDRGDGIRQTSSIAILVLVLSSLGCDPKPNEISVTPVTSSITDAKLAELAPQIRVFCGDCHTMPDPAGVAQDHWQEEVRRGFLLYARSGRKDLVVPPHRETIEYFRRRAPAQLDLPNPKNAADGGRVKFRTIPMPPASQDKSYLFAVSHIRWIERPNPSENMLAYCDMSTGDVASISWQKEQPSAQRLYKAINPSHVEFCDLNADGKLDLLVADLGSFLPEDHDRGRILWLRRDSTSDQYHPVVIKEGLGRVADVEPGDFDGDGDLDLIVAEFGWQKTGRILLLENSKTNDNEADFIQHEIDKRHGTIHVPAADLNGDGRLDFVALISQEFEVIEAFLNEGNGKFLRQPIFAANDASYGSSGIQLVDLDQDKDLDVLYTNGDTYDSLYISPRHSIQWLENLGQYPFRHHPLTKMPGVHVARAHDMDKDGDLDIVACAMLPEQLRADERSKRLDSVIWLEHTSHGEFVRRKLAGAPCQFPALEVGDFNADGLPDLAVGNFQTVRGSDVPNVTLWIQTADLQKTPADSFGR